MTVVLVILDPSPTYTVNRAWGTVIKLFQPLQKLYDDLAKSPLPHMTALLTWLTVRANPSTPEALYDIWTIP